MDDLVQFLRDRLDEDEQAIEAPETWTEFEESTRGTRRVDVDHSFERVTACTRAWRGVHIARHDPARVLREVDATRRLVHEYAQVADNDIDEPYEYAYGWANGLGRAVRLLALPYADHPDYRDDWRP
ncbi:DUF6221 family protein [Streptomyces cyaneofuscatus]|uniref:DUF6221 family protein n=1 Tax=Streptomyces cyaneofuscatus TaxID=66883 RepID=UPI0033E4BBF8